VRQVSARQHVLDHFPVYGPDGFTKVTGLTANDLRVTVYRDGAVVSATVSIAEIAGSPGEYRLIFTPDVAGLWEVEVAYVAGRQVYSQEVDVTEAVVTGSSRPPGWV
jgi:hypothetical protein